MAKEKPEEQEEQEQPREPKKKSGLKWVVISLVLVLVLGAAGAAGWFFLANQGTAKPAAPKPAVLAIWPMDPFIVNIAEAGGDRYLKLVIQLEVTEKESIAELDQLRPRLRDTILDLLTSRAHKDLVDLSGKQRLREDIAGRVNNNLSKGKVTKVYFTDFVIQ
jgi:flagellar FliL protein